MDARLLVQQVGSLLFLNREGGKFVTKFFSKSHVEINVVNGMGGRGKQAGSI
jgi:hypothetical protein